MNNRSSSPLRHLDQPTPPQNLVGASFGNWSVISRGGYRYREHFWTCRCACGTEREVSIGHLRSGNSKSCGGCNRFKNPKGSARRSVTYAVDTGKLIRPLNCEWCHKPSPVARDGRPTIQGHHHKGYDFPLDVIWLCVKCHRQADPVVAGEANGRAKLTSEAVALIRARYKPSGLRPNPNSLTAIAVDFGVSHGTIGRIIRNIIWIDKNAIRAEFSHEQ